MREFLVLRIFLFPCQKSIPTDIILQMKEFTYRHSNQNKANFIGRISQLCGRVSSESTYVQAACCNKGESAVRRLQRQTWYPTGASECTFKWASVCVHSLIQITSFIHSPCMGRKSRGLAYVVFQGKRWASSSWNDRGGNGTERKRETERQEKRRERKSDEIGRHFGPSVGTVPVNASDSWLLQWLPITHQHTAYRLPQGCN